jgi:hypothetical protein
MPSKEPAVPRHSFIVNGKRVHVECEGDVFREAIVAGEAGMHTEPKLTHTKKSTDTVSTAGSP